MSNNVKTGYEAADHAEGKGMAYTWELQLLAANA